MDKINLIIVEDHPFTRQTLSYELKKVAKINVAGVFDNGKSAVDFCLKNKVDVILMDIAMPDYDGILATKEIKKSNPDTKIIMLTLHADPQKVFGAFSSGANGYCIKNIKTNELLNIIDIVANGGVWFDSQISNLILDILKNIKQEEIKKTATAKDYKITPAERTILKLIADGYTNAQIAQTLVLSISTVKNHISSIIKKLAVKDRTQIAIVAIKNKLLD